MFDQFDQKIQTTSISILSDDHWLGAHLCDALKNRGAQVSLDSLAAPDQHLQNGPCRDAIIIVAQPTDDFIAVLIQAARNGMLSHLKASGSVILVWQTNSDTERSERLISHLANSPPFRRVRVHAICLSTSDLEAVSKHDIADDAFDELLDTALFLASPAAYIFSGHSLQTGHSSGA